MTDTATPDNTEEVDQEVTPDNTEETPESPVETPDSTTEDEEVDLGQVGQDFQESKRVAKLSQKEVSKYRQHIDDDGEVDYDEIAKIYRGNNVSDKALEIFCQENGLDVTEAKHEIAKPSDREKELEARVAELEARDAEKAKKESFTDVLQNELDARGISTKEFSRYKDEFEGELQDLTGLDNRIAIKKALDLSIGKPGGTKSPVKVVTNDPSPKGDATDSTMSKEEYLNYQSKRSREVGDEQAVKDFEEYQTSQKAKGLPLYK